MCVCRGLFKDLRNLQKVLLSVLEVYWATQWVRLPAFLLFSLKPTYTHRGSLTCLFCFDIIFPGGAAGMVSRITGTVGKGLAAITMDKEYQQKRREEMNRPTKDFGESLAKGGIGFLKVLNKSSYTNKKHPRWHQNISLSISCIVFSMSWRLLCFCSPSGSGWWSNRNCDQTGGRYGGLLLL